MKGALVCGVHHENQDAASLVLERSSLEAAYALLQNKYHCDFIVELCKNICLQQIRSSHTWFSPLWRWMVWYWWGLGSVLLPRRRPSVPETFPSMLPDYILKINPENNQ